MSIDKVDAAIADATIAPVEPSATEPEVKPEQDAQEAVKPEVKDPWPKSAKNKVSRLERETRILRAKAQERERELTAELEKYKSQQQPKPQNSTVHPDAPRLEDYETFDDYNRAIARFEAKQVWAEGQKQQQEQQLTQDQQRYFEERSNYATQKADEAIAAIPDFEEVIGEYSDVIDAMPQHIEMIALELDNSPLAIYQLAKEGKLESLFTMSPARAAAELAKAEMRGETVKAKPVTSAPAPMQPVKGSGTGSKSVDSMSYAELKAAGFTDRNR